MGLDMYLLGRKHLVHSFNQPDRTEDGYRISGIELSLGYWRKHPDLHGFIVQAFGEGQDQCQEIHLTATSIRNIISAIKTRRLPHTEGFFFGQSENSVRQHCEDIKIFEGALKWLEAVKTPKLEKVETDTLTAIKVDSTTEWPAEFRSVIYQASW